MQSILINIKPFRDLLLLAVAFSVFTVPANAQTSGKTVATPVRISVVSSSGTPVSMAEIVIGEGADHFTTDYKGTANVTAGDSDEITIRRYGYKSVITTLYALRQSGQVTLSEAPIFTDSKDDISLPFSVESKRYSTGSAYKIDGRELERIPSTDIRRGLTGIVPGLEIVQNYGGPGMTPMERIGKFGSAVKTSTNMRGVTPVYMVDGIPVDIAETPLDPEQIESMSVIKDVTAKALYGPYAANGIINITTKRGMNRDRYLKVNYEEGVNVVDRMAEFVNGTDYAKMNNIARHNSGMDMLYTREAVEQYAKNDPYNILYPNVDFRSMMLKNTASYRKVNVSSGGGNDRMTYYAFLGYDTEGDLYKIGPESNYNRLNFSANLNVKVNDFIKTRFGFYSNLSNRKSPNYGYNADYSSEDESSNWTMDVIEFSRVMGHLTTIPHISFPVYTNNSTDLTRPQYAVNSLFTQNPIGNMMHNGSYTDRIRKGLINACIDMDFSFLLKGLTSSTYVAYDANSLIRLGTAEDYDAYLISRSTDINGNEIPALTKSGSHTLKEMANRTKLTDYHSERMFGYQRFNYENSFGKHDVGAALNMFMTKRVVKYISEHRREMTGTFAGTYAYNKKYLFNMALAYSGTYSLRNHRRSFSPTFSAGWILTEEKFMRNIHFLDYLKLRASAGILSYDGSMSANRDIDNYGWNTSGQAFGPHSSNQWFGSTVSGGTATVHPSLIGNPNLRLEKRKEFNAGIEGTALGKRLYFELNYYNNLHDGPVTNAANIIPYLTGITGAKPWINYNQTRYFGFEFAARYDGNKGNDFSYSIGLNATVQNSKVVRMDELDYSYPYQSRVGYPEGSIYGLVCMGQYATDAEAAATNQMYDETLHAGDLKYKDMNGDGMIDDNDRCYIGNSTPKLFYGLSVNLRYKDFDLNVLGSGRAFYDIQMTNEYFWNGWGNNNYSQFTKDHYGRNGYPQLTYEKVNNNYKLSSFWLQDGSYFKIRNIELGWNVPVKRWKLNYVGGIRVYAKAANVLTLSKVKDVDPEAIDSGISHYPLSRTFVGGVQLTF